MKQTSTTDLLEVIMLYEKLIWRIAVCFFKWNNFISASGYTQFTENMNMILVDFSFCILAFG